LIKQTLLAIALILVPAAAFTGFQVYAKNEPTAAAGLGDLSSLKAIIADVQGIAAKGDLTGAAKRITDFESAWDEGEAAIRPLNPTYWGNIDHASDAALRALREPTPSAEKVQRTLVALMAVLNNPAQPAE
jgi:hypothetical protein